MVRAEAIVVHRLERAAPVPLLSSGWSRLPIISSRSFEVTELCSIFGGRKLHTAYTCLFLCYLLSTSWAYAFVFSEALSTEVPIFGFQVCSPDDPCPLYRVYALVFLSVAVPLSLLEPTEQAAFQVAMTLFRGLVALGMTLTALFEAYYPGMLFERPSSTEEKAIVWGRLRSLNVLLPATIFALNINGNVPLIAKSMRDREQVDIATRVGLWLPCVMYIFIGVSIAATFGKCVPRSANIVWRQFGVSNNGALVASTSHLFATFIVLFPAADVLSIFPLNTIVVADNILAVYYGDKIDKIQHNTHIRRLFRLFVAVPPIVGACLCANFTKIIDYTGVLAIVISCIFSPLLSILGRETCRSEFGDHRLDNTRYSIDGSRLWPKFAVMAAGVVATSLALFLP